MLAEIVQLRQNRKTAPSSWNRGFVVIGLFMLTNLTNKSVYMYKSDFDLLTFDQPQGN